MVQAATQATKHGFARTATLAGGLQALNSMESQKVRPSPACEVLQQSKSLFETIWRTNMENLMQVEPKFINRDAVAGVLGHVDAGCPPQQAVVLDIRRHDERALYGSIPGNNLPVHCLHPPFPPAQNCVKHSSEQQTMFGTQGLCTCLHTSYLLPSKWHLRPGRRPSTFPGRHLKTGSSCSAAPTKEQPGLHSWQQMLAFSAVWYTSRYGHAVLLMVSQGASNLKFLVHGTCAEGTRCLLS